MQMGSMADSFRDASGASQTDRASPYGVTGRPSQYGMPGAVWQLGIPGRELFNCALRARGSGFRSSVVSLIEYPPSSGSINVGAILVQRGVKIEGMTVSATTYAAPKDARKAYEKGLEAEKNGKGADARRYFEKAVEAYPRHANAWFHLGTLLQKENQNDAARMAYTQATTADSRFLPPYLSLASMAGEAENWTEGLSLTGYILYSDSFNYPDSYFYHAV